MNYKYHFTINFMWSPNLELTAVKSDAHLDHLVFESPNPKKMAEFYSKAIDMKMEKVNSESWLSIGPERKIIFTRGEKNNLLYAGFSCRDLQGLDELKIRAVSEKVQIKKSISEFFNDDAFAVTDPDGNEIIFGLSSENSEKNSGLHAPLQHLTFASSNVEAFEDFYHNKLGFSISDRVIHKDGSLATSFLRSNHEHHTLACFKSSKKGVDHHSYETGDWTRIKDWCDRFSNLGIKLMWGPGRHGPGNNLFIFIEDPDNNWIEISAELETMHNRPLKNWPQEPNTLNLWGPHSIMRS